MEAPAATAAPKADAVADEDDEDGAEDRATWSLERRTAEELVQGLVEQWQAPMDALANAGKAFEGLEALLGGASGGSFDLKVHSYLSLMPRLEIAKRSLRCRRTHFYRSLGMTLLQAKHRSMRSPHQCSSQCHQVAPIGCRRPSWLASPCCVEWCRATCGSGRGGRRWTRCARSWKT